MLVHQATVVRGIPEDGIVRDLEVAEGFAQATDLFVDESDFLIIWGVWSALVETGIGRSFSMGIVWRGEPNDSEGWLCFGVCFEVIESVIHRDHGSLALELLESAVEREIGVAVEEVESTEPVVKALAAGRGGAFLLH